GATGVGDAPVRSVRVGARVGARAGSPVVDLLPAPRVAPLGLPDVAVWPHPTQRLLSTARADAAGRLEVVVDADVVATLGGAAAAGVALADLLLEVPGIRLRLRGRISGMDLAGLDLCGLDAADAELCGVDLSGSDLTDADLRGARLDDVDLSCSILYGCNLAGAALHLVWVDGTHAHWDAMDDAVLATAELLGEPGPELALGLQLRGILRGEDRAEVEVLWTTAPDGVPTPDTTQVTMTVLCPGPGLPPVVVTADERLYPLGADGLTAVVPLGYGLDDLVLVDVRRVGAPDDPLGQVEEAAE
ncbi:MAG: pentapeptide repeat-containing protein, partial [Phycicoccus sp.]